MNDTAENSVGKVSTKVFVENPEQIQFTFEIAGVGQRILAYLLDLLIRVAVIVAASIVIVTITGGAPFGLGVIAVLSFLLEWGYFTVLEWVFNGVTPGKKAMRLRVVRTDGVSVDLYRSAMRNLLRAADGFPPVVAALGLFPVPSYAVGIFVIFATGTGRRLGDLVADTMVIREDKVYLRDLPPLPEGAVHLSPEVVLRNRLHSRDLGLIDEYFRRRHLFSKERARELAAIIAEPLAIRLKMENEDPEKLIAGVLLAGFEQRTSFTGRDSVIPMFGRGGERRQR